MPRLFFALYPDDNTRSRLISLIQQIPSTLCIIPENLHLTLHFIGQTNVQDCLIGRAQKILCNPFNLIIGQYGYFNRAKVLWAGPKQYSDDLTQLARNCAISAIACGCSNRDESFTPHVSLMRKISDKPALHNSEPFEWTVHSFYLMESESNQAGVQYRVIREFPMQEI
jgi:2'-5' RNA ligase